MNTLITGSSSGIGFATAFKFASTSNNIWITGRDLEKLRKARRQINFEHPKCRVEISCLDLTDKKSVRTYVEEVKDRWTVIDNLILNLGSGRPKQSTESTEEAERRLHLINYVSPKLILNLCESLFQNNESSIVYVSSIATQIDVGAPLQYVKSKQQFEKYLMSSKKIILNSNLRINIVRPGHILIANGIWDENSKIQDKNKILETLNRIPLGRFGSPIEVASLIYFLCSQEAQNIKFSSINIDGGLSLTQF